MEAACSSETLVATFRNTQCHYPEDWNLDCKYSLFTEQKRKEAVAAANNLTQALVDHLNVG
jgi:hypothetical protein